MFSLKVWFFSSALFFGFLWGTWQFVTLWNRFMAECDLICRFDQLNSAVKNFTTENPLVSIVIIASLLGGIVAAATITTDRHPEDTGTTKKKTVVTLGDDGEMIFEKGNEL